MKRFILLAAFTGAFVLSIQAGLHAQDPPTGPATPARSIGIDKLKIGPKFANPDLAVVEFMGAFRGSDYVLGGKVTNVGNAEYTRTRTISGRFQGRKLQLFAINNGGLGKGGTTTLLRTFTVPSLKAKATWATPTITIPAKQVPGSATAHFLLKLSGTDVDTANDWKQIIVSPVH